MSYAILRTFALAILTASVLWACGQQKAAIRNKAEAVNNSINHRMDAMDVATNEAGTGAEVYSAVEMARIKAKKVAALAQLDGDVRKAHAMAALERAILDAEQK